MNDVLKNCLADYPTLSSKVKDYLKQVVHKACSHQGTFTVCICFKLKPFNLRQTLVFLIAIFISKI